MEKIPYLGATLLRWQVGRSSFLALPERGARLMNWNLGLGDGSVRDVLYWPEISTLERFEQVRGGNPILFPFAGRTYDRGEVNHWRADDGIRRPMPRHGFARQGEFKLVRLDERGFAAQLVPGAEARSAYPFDYEFVITYRFEPLGFSCEMTLSNLGGAPLPWCPGHHFYFTVPWSEGSTRQDYLLDLPAAERLRHDPAGSLVPAPSLPRTVGLSDPTLLDTIHTRLSGPTVAFGEKGRGGDVVIRLGTDRALPPDAAFVTWTEGPESPFYCVEPWMGPPNAPEHKRGLDLVPPGKSRAFVVQVHVR